MQNALNFAKEQLDQSIEQLKDFLRIKSISADPAYNADVREAAQWLSAEFSRIGMQEVEIMETDGHPVVFASYHVDDSLPTVLCYGHYDVQPPDPLELWDYPPFEPTVVGNDLYGRGTSDDKGQLFIHVKAAEAYLATDGSLPVNLKFMIEGEEEVGSAHLVDYIKQNKELLKADVVLVSDTSLFAADVPSITTGLRGLAYVQVELIGPDRDLHSGAYGGAVENPLNALMRLVSNMHDDDHHITIPGFYDDVVELSERDRSESAALPFEEGKWLGSIGIQKSRTEKGYSIVEAKSVRPTLDVNGMWGGYQGEGSKTVLPSKSGAKISMRLVPNQNPEDITKKIRKYFEENTPETMTLNFQEMHGGHPSVVDTDIPAMNAASKAMEGGFGKKPVFVRAGGSIPVIADFKNILGLDTILMGFGLNSDALHSPNEKFGLDRFEKGIYTSVQFFTEYAKQ